MRKKIKRKKSKESFTSHKTLIMSLNDVRTNNNNIVEN